MPVGLETATIRIISNDPLEPSVDLTTTGILGIANIATAIADNGDFGHVCRGCFAEETLTINNTGTCLLRISNITSSSPEFMTPSVISYPLVVSAGGSIDLAIRLQPASFGPKDAVITIDSNAISSPHTIRVSGFVPSGKLAVTGSLCFGGVRACCRAERTISICNVGDCDLHVTSVAFKRKNPHWKLINNPFPATLHPGSCLSIVIRYKATEKCPVCSELVIKSDDPVTPVKTLDVMAYTIWDDCSCKKSFDDRKKDCCTKHYTECCCEGSADDCCQDEQDEDIVID
jgi:hypothetical protein